jgi:hypothetical protein
MGIMVQPTGDLSVQSNHVEWGIALSLNIMDIFFLKELNYEGFERDECGNQ